jgi:hypothetical protein
MLDENGRWDGQRFVNVAFSPDGPKMLRRIVRQLSAQHKRRIPFAEAAQMLRGDIEARRFCEQQIEQAWTQLKHALTAGELVLWGKRSADAPYEPVPRAFFLSDTVVRCGEMIMIEPGEQSPGNENNHSTFFDVRCFAEEVSKVWKREEADSVGPPLDLSQ